MANSSVALNVPVPASQADMEAATDVVLTVTPGRQKFHPGHPKFWVIYTSISSTSITTSFNVASLTDNGVGDTTITYTAPFSGASYSVVGNLQFPGNNTYNMGIFNSLSGTTVSTNAPLAGSCRVVTLTAAQSPTDAVCNLVGFGDQ